MPKLLSPMKSSAIIIKEVLLSAAMVAIDFDELEILSLLYCERLLASVCSACRRHRRCSFAWRRRQNRTGWRETDVTPSNLALPLGVSRNFFFKVIVLRCL